MDRFKLISGLVVVFVALIVGSCQDDKNVDSSNPISNKELSEDDNANKEILLSLLDSEKFFLDVSSLGSERATTNEIKDFSLNAKIEHLKNYEKLKTFCIDKGYEIPEKLSKANNDKLYKLTITNTADFDNYFKQNLINEYKIRIDSTAKYINEKTYVEALDVLTIVEANYRKNLNKIEKIK